jgi:hypothetical protein
VVAQLWWFRLVSVLCGFEISTNFIVKCIGVVLVELVFCKTYSPVEA